MASPTARSHHQPRTGGPASGVRFRASKACRSCHEKRVKCDASERGMPCTRCEERQIPDCRLIQSRRGIYTRKSRQQQPTPSSTSTSASASRNGEVINVDEGTNGPLPSTAQTVIQPSPTAPLSSNPPDTIIVLPEDEDQRNAGRLGQPVHVSSPAREPRSGANWLADDPSLARPCSIPEWTQHLAPSSGPPAEHDTPSGRTDTSTTSSYREISWAAMFDHLLEGQQKGEDVVDKCSITYLGESFPLAIVLKDLRGGRGPTQLHHSGPPCPAPEELVEAQSLHHPPYMRPEEIAFLEAKKAFEVPDSRTLGALIEVFLHRVLPLYPIVNRHEFLEEHRTKRIPWILLHALCFISATFCPSNILHQAGFSSRRQARWLFYSKAKALFDVGYEGNKIVALQVAILMSFWGGGPNNYWNFYSWISTGVTIAETIGCHRSMAGTNMKPQDRSLLKRLWWILVVRDTACAALVGRPFRIHLDHCDVDALSPEDCEDETASSAAVSSSGGSSCALYQVQVTELTLILRRIIMARFYPTGDSEGTSTSSSLHHMLTEWRARLPPQLSWTDNSSDRLSIFTSSLAILYNHHVILAYLHNPPEPLQGSPLAAFHERQAEQDRTSGAAQQIVSMASAVVMKSEVLLAPHELFHAIFIAAVIFYMQTKSSSQLTAQLGMSGLTNCKMLLHEIRDF